MKLFWVGCSGLPYSVGDNAQTLAVQKIIDEFFSDYELVRLSLNESLKLLRMDVNPDDLIFLHSGGGFGDLYRDWTLTIQTIVAAFPDNRIIQLPVSIYYGDEGNFEADKMFFCNRPNFTLLCRSPVEAEKLQQNFNCHVEHFPDFAYYLKPEIKNCKRDGVLFVLRNDCESVLFTRIGVLLNRITRKFERFIRYAGRVLHKDLMFIVDEKTQQYAFSIIRSYIESKVTDATVCDIQVSNVPINDGNREEVVFATLDCYMKFKCVVTDRFHGLVFAALTNTPAYALPTLISEKTAYPNQTCNRSIFREFRQRFVTDFKISKSNLPLVAVDVLDIIRQRRSVRRWLNKPVSNRVVKLLVEMGYWAPTAANTQAVNLYPITDLKTIKNLCQHTSPWFKNANPALIIVVSYDEDRAKECGSSLKDWTSRFVWQDTSVCMTTLMLAAESLGLKSCWASCVEYDAEAIGRILTLPKSELVTCMLLLGYSNQHVSLDATHHGRKIRRNKLEQKS